MILLCVIAFVAGFVDAIVGGGGLIQTPAGLILMPNESVASVIGSLKIPSFTGTFFAAREYLQKVKIPLKRILLFTSIAFAASAVMINFDTHYFLLKYQSCCSTFVISGFPT